MRHVLDPLRHLHQMCVSQIPCQSHHRPARRLTGRLFQHGHSAGGQEPLAPLGHPVGLCDDALGAETAALEPTGYGVLGENVRAAGGRRGRGRGAPGRQSV